MLRSGYRTCRGLAGRLLLDVGSPPPRRLSSKIFLLLTFSPDVTLYGMSAPNTIELPPFQPSKECAVCGFVPTPEQVEVVYYPKIAYSTEHLHPGRIYNGVPHPEEHLSRKCSRCGYTWAEACLGKDRPLRKR